MSNYTKTAQTILKKAGFYKSTIDGDFGKNSQTAAREYYDFPEDWRGDRLAVGTIQVYGTRNQIKVGIIDGFWGNNTQSGYPKILDLLGIKEPKPVNVDQNIIINNANLDHGNILLTDDLVDLAKLASSKSILTGGEKQRRTITSPKIFERVLNVFVDPYDFEIDIEKTNSTEAGRLTLRRLIVGEMIRTETLPNLRGTATFMVRPSIGSDVTVDQYFVVVSRYEPPESLREKYVHPARGISNLRGQKPARGSRASNDALVGKKIAGLNLTVLKK